MSGSGSEPDPAREVAGDLGGAARWDNAWAGEVSFARRPYTRDLSDADLVVLGAPFDLATTNRSGARFGPRAIREQSLLVAQFPGAHWPWEGDLFSAHTTVDYSDVTAPVGELDRIVAEVDTHVGRILDAGAAPLTLGGDHVVAYPALKAVAARHGPVALVHLDAHCDTWEAEGRLDHGTMFGRAVAEGLVDVAHSIQIGMRTPGEDCGTEVIPADEMLELGMDAVAARVHHRVGSRPAYLSIDIDFLDPAFAPGTGTPVVGGPSTAEGRRLLWGLTGVGFVAADLVEVAPMWDGPGQITALAGATLALDALHLLGRARGALHLLAT